MQYSEKVIEHFTHPHNVGKLEDANGIGEVGNAKCGDIMKMYLKVENGVIEDVKFNTYGCASAIATSSIEGRGSIRSRSSANWRIRRSTKLATLGNDGDRKDEWYYVKNCKKPT